MKSFPHDFRQFGYLFLTRIGWEKRQSLLTKCSYYYRPHSVFNSNSHLSDQQCRSGRAPPSGFCLYAVRITQSTTNFSLPSAFINSHFRVVSKSDLLPLFEKQVLIGGSHPSLPKYFSYEVTYWRLIIYIISRTNIPVYPYLDMFVNSFWKSYGKCGLPARTRSLAKCTCG